MNRPLLSEKTGTFDRLRMSSYLTFRNVVKEAALKISCLVFIVL